MKIINRIKDQREPDNANSTSKIIFDNYNTIKLTDEPTLNQRRILMNKNFDHPRMIKKTSEFSMTKSPTNKTTFGGPHGTTTASIIIWYVCICLLFVIAFLALVLSVLYFLTDSSTEQVIKLYGITGSGSLAIVTFVIIFLDCCTDGDREDHDEEAIYRILQVKENRDKDLAKRRTRRVHVKREEQQRKPLVTQQQQQQRSEQVHKNPPPTSTYHHHHYPQPHHVHHIHAHPSGSYHYPHTCSYCRYSHKSNGYRYNQTDVAVDTSDRLETISESKRAAIQKSTRDAQTEPKLADIEHGTRTDRTEGTQTSTVQLDNPLNNVSEIILEKKALKTPRNSLPVVEEPMQQQDKDFEISRTISDTTLKKIADI